MKREAWRQYYCAASAGAYSAAFQIETSFDAGDGADVVGLAHAIACKAAKRALDEEESLFGDEQPFEELLEELSEARDLSEERAEECRSQQRELVLLCNGIDRLVELLWPADSTGAMHARPHEDIGTEELLRLLADRVESLQAELAETKHVLEQERDEVSTFKTLAEERAYLLSCVENAARADAARGQVRALRTTPEAATDEPGECA